MAAGVGARFRGELKPRGGAGGVIGGGACARGTRGRLGGIVRGFATRRRRGRAARPSGETARRLKTTLTGGPGVAAREKARTLGRLARFGPSDPAAGAALGRGARRFGPNARARARLRGRRRAAAGRASRAGERSGGLHGRGKERSRGPDRK